MNHIQLLENLIPDSLNPFYGVNSCHGVNMCYGVNLCYGVNMCYGVNIGIYWDIKNILNVV